MAAEGALFILHLKLEGKIIDDRHGIIERILDSYNHPDNYEPLLGEMVTISKLLDVSPAFYGEHVTELHETALFIIRTVLYAWSAAQRPMSFSFKDNLLRWQIAESDAILALQHRIANWTAFDISCQWLRTVLGPNVSNECGSIEALLVKYFGTSRRLEQFGIRILSKGRDTLRY